MHPEHLLDQWESYLRPQVERVDLLGEISLSYDQVDELGRLIGDLVRQYGWGKAECLLREKYPCSFAVFLVATGAREYEAGRFWGAVRKFTGLDILPAQARSWGQLFEGIVAGLPVVRFPPMGGHRYVELILAHGGIPDYCLADFFENFLKPLIEQAEYATLPVEEFIQRRLRHYTAEYLTDQPVRRFLEHGGPSAVDFVERCREMAERYAETGETPSPEEVGLPSRVVEEYQAWLKGEARHVLHRRTAYRSPILSLDPWGDGVFLYLPSQPVPASRPDRTIFWRVHRDEQKEAPESVPVEIYQEGDVWKTVPARLPLIPPASEYIVWFDPFPGSWRIPGLLKDYPLLWFYPADGSRLPNREYLPPTRLWLLRTPDVTLETEPPDALRITERLPRQPGGWSEFIGEELDLSQVQRLIVRWGDILREYPIWGRGHQDQPTLEGEHRLLIDDGRPPFYVGRPPRLRIPLPAGFHPRRWSVTVRNEGPALPEMNVSCSPENLDHSGNVAILDLGSILGSAPMGTYQVKLRGPLGSKADLSFRILPAMEMSGHEDVYLLDDAEKEAHILVETDARTIVTLSPGTPHCRIAMLESEKDRILYEIIARPERVEIPLQFVRRTDSGETVSVPLSVPVRRLRWRVVLDREQLPNAEWRMIPMTLPLDALEQSREPLLLVDLFGGTDWPVEAVLRLEDGEACLQEEKGHPRRGHSHLRFDLTAFRDTLRRTSSAHLTFSLLLRGIPGKKEERAYPVLHITRRFDVQQAQADGIYKGDRVYLRLRWQTTVRVRGLFARLWPVWRPWEDPVEISIPDDATSEYWCVLPAIQLPPGRYLLEFGVRDPWAAGSDSLPPSLTDPIIPSVLLPPHAVILRLQELQRQALKEGLSFPLALETALIRQDWGQQHLADQALKWCYEHLYERLGEAEVRYMLAFVRSIVGKPDLEGPTRMKMAAVQRIQQVLDLLQHDTPANALYREYLKELPPSFQWSTETCELLLAADDPSVRFQAAIELLRREHLQGIQAIIRWFLDGSISEKEALDILEKSLPMSVQGLLKALPNPMVLRLLESLEQQCPDRVPSVLVRPGHWVRCAAGWGEVKRIEAADGTRREYFIVSAPEPGLQLRVLLRAHESAHSEEIIIDLDTGMLIFQGVKEIYVCTKCEQFATTNPHLIVSEHNRSAHEGIGPSYRVEKITRLQQTIPMKFVFRMPQNPWV